MDIHITAIIRDRGQITIPNKIRKRINWAQPNTVISITIPSNKKIVIEPFEKKEQKKVDWDKIWEGIKWARSIKGKRGNLSKFIVEDRERH